LPPADAARLEQIVNQATKMLDLAVDDGTRPGTACVSLFGDCQHSAGGRNRGQRIPQLVPEHGEEVVLCPVLRFRSVALLGANVDFGLHLHRPSPELLVHLGLLFTAALEEQELGHVLDAMDDVRDGTVPPDHRIIYWTPVPFLEGSAIGLWPSNVILLHG
jgi:hypothetical protein